MSRVGGPKTIGVADLDEDSVMRQSLGSFKCLFSREKVATTSFPQKSQKTINEDARPFVKAQKVVELLVATQTEIAVPIVLWTTL